MTLRTKAGAKTKLTALRADIATARRWAETADETASAAKTEFKRSRKLYRHARKVAKQARKELKSLKKLVKATTAKLKAPTKKTARKGVAKEGRNVSTNLQPRDATPVDARTPTTASTAVAGALDETAAASAESIVTPPAPNESGTSV